MLRPYGTRVVQSQMVSTKIKSLQDRHYIPNPLIVSAFFFERMDSPINIISKSVVIVIFE